MGAQISPTPWSVGYEQLRVAGPQRSVVSDGSCCGEGIGVREPVVSLDASGLEHPLDRRQLGLELVPEVAHGLHRFTLALLSTNDVEDLTEIDPAGHRRLGAQEAIDGASGRCLVLQVAKRSMGGAAALSPADEFDCLRRSMDSDAQLRRRTTLAGNEGKVIVSMTTLVDG